MHGGTRSLVPVVLILGSCGVLWQVNAAAAPAAREVMMRAAPAGPAYASELDAVIAASSEVNARSIEEDREYIGGILRRGDDFHYSVASGQAGADRIQARLAVPDGYELVALWHTHGAAAPERRYFSSTDAALVARMGKPLYLADFSGALRVLRPGAPTLSTFAARKRGLGGRAGSAEGERLHGANGELVRIPTRMETAPAMMVSN